MKKAAILGNHDGSPRPPFPLGERALYLMGLWLKLGPDFD